MKKLLLSLFTLCLFLSSKAQTEGWQKKASLMDDIPSRHVSNMVSYNGKLYFFGGVPTSGQRLKDFWEYDPATKKIASMGTLPESADGNTCAIVGNKLFFGLGFLSNGPKNNLWREYNFATKIFTSKTPFPGERSIGGIGTDRPPSFVVNDTIFVASTGNRAFYSYNVTTDKWTRRADYPGTIRANAITFSINGKGYFGGGGDAGGSPLQDFYEYNPILNTWTSKASTPIGVSISVSTVSNGKGYFGTGSTSTEPTGAWYEYNPTTNAWAQKSNGPKIYNSTSATVGSDIFLFSGTVQGSIVTGALFNYNTIANTWTTETLHLGGNRASTNSIFYNGKIIIAGGEDLIPRKDVWAYDIASDTWERKNDMIGLGHAVRAQATINNKLYLVGGLYTAWNGYTGPIPMLTKELIEYNPANDTWATKAPYPGLASLSLAAFTVGGHLYAGLGTTDFINAASSLSTFAKYDPNTDTWTALTAAPEGIIPVSSFAIGNIGYVVSKQGKLFAYNTLTNSWSLKAQVPLAIPSLGRHGSTNKGFNYNGKGYFLSSNGQQTLLLEYDATTDSWAQKSSGSDLRFGSVVTVAGDEVYHGFGTDIDEHPTNQWWKLNFTPPVSVLQKEIQHPNYYLHLNAYQTLFDSLGHVTSSLKSISTAGFASFKSSVISSSASYREHEGWFGGTQKELGMYFNRSLTFNVASQSISSLQYRIYAPKTEIDKFVAAFNSKYGTSYTENDIKVVSQNSNIIDTNPLNQEDIAVNNKSIIPTIGTYLTTNRYFEFSAPNGTEFYLTLSTKRAEQTITFPTLVNKVYGNVDFDPGAISNNNTIPITYTSSNPSVATIVAGKIHIVGVGSAIIIAKQAASFKFHEAAEVSKVLIVTKAPLTITAKNATKIYDGIAYEGGNGTTFTGLVAGDTELNSVTGTVAFSGASQGAKNAGKYVITPSGYVAINYIVIYANGELVIDPKPLTITADDKTRVQGAANPAFTASYSGFVNSESSAVLIAQPAFSTTATAASVPGTYPITPSGATSPNYEVTYVNGKLVVAPAPPLISSFTPTTSITGATLTITGNYFTGATAVSLGGVPAASFTVVSATSITAIVAAGASGNVSVTTPIGTGTLSGYTFVPKPTITAGGQTTFASGGSVVLTASPGSGFSYKWAKDGADITGATAASYTASATGSYTVTITANSISQSSAALAVSSIFVLPANNFKITATGETCKTSNNGSINITATQSKSYTAVLTGNGLNLSKPFTTTVDFNDLQAGTYNVCVTVAGEAAYKQCFDVVITEPKDLSVFAVVDKGGNTISLALDGSSSYFVELNGSIFKTDKDKLNLSLRPGNNTLKVYTGTVCQGVFEKNIQLFDQPMVYPNPFQDVLNLLTSPSVKTVVEIRNLQGRLVFNQQFNNENGKIALALENLEAGIYVLKAISAESESIYRIIKK